MKIKLLLILLILLPKILSGETEWIQTNGPYAGYAQFIGMDYKGDLFARVYNGSLFRSKDNSESWELVADSISAIAFGKDSTYYLGYNNGDMYIYDKDFSQKSQIRKHVNSNEIVYEIYLDSASNIYSHVGGSDLLFSSDKGITWSETKNYGALIDENNYYYVFHYRDFRYSKDLGQTWENLVLFEEDIYSDARFPIYNKKFKSFVYVCSNNEVIIFSKKDSVWEKVSVGYPIGRPSAVFLDNTGDIYAFEYNNITKSTDGGYTWSILTYDFPFAANSIVKKENSLYIAVDNKGIFKYDLISNTYSKKSKGINCAPVKQFVKGTNNDIFVLTYYELFRTSDFGLSWDKLNLSIVNFNFSSLYCSKFGTLYYNGDLTDYSIYGYYTSTDRGDSWIFNDLGDDSFRNIHFSEFDDGLIFMSLENVLYSSEDFGKTWKFCYRFNSTIKKMLTYYNKLIIYFENGYIYKSEEKGKSFQKLDFGNPENEYSDIIINSKGQLYIVNSEKREIIFSEDFGKTYSTIIPNNFNYLGTLFIDKEDNLYNNVYGLLYLSKDNGINWKGLDQGILGKVKVSDILFIDEKTAFLGTWYNGIYRTDNYRGIKNEGKEFNADLGIYPNPASDYITLNIPPLEKRGLGGVPDSSPFFKGGQGVFVCIYDVFGNCVKTYTPSSLRDATPQEGNLRIDISTLPAGVYFVKIGEKVEKFMKI